MIKPIPNYLKLHLEESAPSETPSTEEVYALSEYHRCFELATGWKLETEIVENVTTWPAAESPLGEIEPLPFLLKPVEGEAGKPDQGAVTAPPVELKKAHQLAHAVNGLVCELQITRQELWRREAELAAGIPVAARTDEEAHLAVRLEMILKGGAKATGCQAAALYLLDDATTQLKLRACWGLPKKCLLAPARPLRGAVADLEALMGQAVVLEDTTLLPHWKVPESYAAAVCVPVSSPTEPLGTLWFFGEHVRQFSDDQTNLVEIIAGRVASELQRETLLNDCVSSRELNRELLRASQWQQARLPSIKPLLDDWDIAGWTSSANLLGRAFHDWFVPPDGSLAIALGAAEGSMMESALTAAVLHASVRAHSSYSHDAGRMVAQANETFWNSSAGGQFASLFYGLIQPETGRCEWSHAGQTAAFAMNRDGIKRLTIETGLLGTDLDELGHADVVTLQPRDTLVLANHSLLNYASDASQRFSEWLDRTREEHLNSTAEQFLDSARQYLEHDCSTDLNGALLVVRRGAGDGEIGRRGSI